MSSSVRGSYDHLEVMTNGGPRNPQATLRRAREPLAVPHPAPVELAAARLPSVGVADRWPARPSAGCSRQPTLKFGTPPRLIVVLRVPFAAGRCSGRLQTSTRSPSLRERSSSGAIRSLWLSPSIGRAGGVRGTDSVSGSGSGRDRRRPASSGRRSASRRRPRRHRQAD
jgi:hypothetical protein